MRGTASSDCRKRHQVARPGRAKRDAADQPLEVVHALERVAKLAALGRAKRQLLDGIQPVADALERAERTQQPRAQQPPAHRRDRPIDLVQQRSLRRRPRCRSPPRGASA